jgi:hypothetical protein
MAVKRATEFEALKVLHTLWKSNSLATSEVKRLLKEEFDLELVVLANGSITAESTDKKQQYKINQ